MILNSAKVANCTAAPDGGGGVAGMGIPRTPPGGYIGGTVTSCIVVDGTGGGGGGGEPPDGWKGILAELIYMCSGAELLGVYRCTHLHFV